MGISLEQAILEIKKSGKNTVPNTFLGRDVRVVEVDEVLTFLVMVDKLKVPKLIEVEPWFDEYVKTFSDLKLNKIVIVKNITQIGYGHTLEDVKGYVYKPTDVLSGTLSKYHDEVCENKEMYVRAVLDGYTIKKEPIYLMPVPYQDNVKAYYHKKDGEIKMVYPSNKKHTGFHFTEAEINEHFPLIADLKEEYKDE